MAEPVMVAVAAALVGRAAGAAVGELVRVVRERFGRDKQAQAALEAAQAEPDDETKVEALSEELERVAAQDPELAQAIRAAGSTLSADRGGVVNDISGTVAGPVVQARDVTGGIKFGN